MSYMNSINQIIEDDREIESIEGPGADGILIRVGDYGVTKIKPYSEPSEVDHVIWFAIYKGDEIQSRIPARFVMVRYKL